MTTPDAAAMLPDWPARAAALADALCVAGKLWSPQWRAALQAVPRHVFVPQFYVRGDGGQMVEVSAGDAQWQEQVWSNAALVTKFDDRDGMAEFLSSSSMPGLMTRMLEALDVHGDERVLEIGTGTGYNAALLSHRLGAERVFSIDIEPDLIDQARTRLAALGYHPTLVVGDGAAGLPEHAPFDRIIATCSVPAIPWSWIAQTAVGGILLADLRVGLAAGNLVRLTRVATDRADGRFDPGQASFMGLRHGAGMTARATYAPSDVGPVVESVTRLNPHTPWRNPVVWFLAVLAIGRHYRLGYTGGDPERGPRAVSITIPDGSRAEIDLASDQPGEHRVRESGQTRLWAQVENAFRLWSGAGEPGWSRLGLTVTPDGQTIYVDDPARPLAAL